MSPLHWGATATAARLTARPAAAGSAFPAPAPGLHALDLGPGPEVLVRVPAPSEDDAGPQRLVLTLHGAGGDARGGLAPLLPLADAHRLLLVAPSSRDGTWDVITQGGWGSDVRRIDDALTQVFATHPVDPTRLAISGFSDGASYALSLGLANADLFTHVIAFSPGFLVPTPRTGTPHVYLSHGRATPCCRSTGRAAGSSRGCGRPASPSRSTSSTDRTSCRRTSPRTPHAGWPRRERDVVVAPTLVHRPGTGSQTPR
jgi:phospholipase/carboxylesterase